MCDILVCGVVSDAECNIYKGPPVMNQQERGELARACKWVDEVVENAPYFPNLKILDKLACQCIAHGDDIIKNKKTGKDMYWEFREANRLRVFKRTQGVSTTDIVGRLLLLTKDHHIDSNYMRNSNELDQESLTMTKKPSMTTTSRIKNFTRDFKAPKENDKIVYIAGDWDILHAGHVRILKKAKR